jgi:hypothetical protein
MPDLPDEDQLSRYFSMLGRKGVKIRNQRLTAEQRKEIATKASKAAAEARRKKAAKHKKV